jgi:hypothetical protein
MPRNPEAEAGYWLEIAKHVLSGDISLEEAMHILKLDSLYTEVSEASELSDHARPQAAAVQSLAKNKNRSYSG